MKKSAVNVSDHALIRYLERVVGIDVELHRRQMGVAIDKVMLEGACGVVIAGFDYRIAGETVTTVLEARRPDRRTGRQRRDRDD